MTEWVPWFRYQLNASAEAFVWAAQQLRASDQFTLPPEPNYLGTWPAARHVWHVSGYERCLALPAMRQWVEIEPSMGEDWQDNDAAWESGPRYSMAQYLEEFQAVRQEQLLLLDQLVPADWTALRKTGWGEKSLAWIVTKTFQHTYEHGDTLLRMGLWREHIEAQIAAALALKSQNKGS